MGKDVLGTKRGSVVESGVAGWERDVPIQEQQSALDNEDWVRCLSQASEDSQYIKK
jgi:hypothetical protein